MKNWKLWLNIITFCVLILIIWLARDDIEQVYRDLNSLDLWVLALMIPAQLSVFFTLGEVFYYFFRANGITIPRRKLLAPMVELNFVNHIFPSGGVSGFSYLTLRLKAYGVSTAKSTLAQLARFAFMFFAFTILLLVALFLLAIEDRVGSLVVLVVSGVVSMMIFATAVLLFVISSESRAESFSSGLARQLNRLIRIIRPKKPEAISLRRVRKTFQELHEDYVILRHNTGRLRQVVFWAFLATLTEVLLLYIAFVAHGEWVNPGAVMIAFAVANIAGFIAILPGGIGVYEPLMTAVLISAGVPAGLALSATLVYRVVSLLLSLISGYALYQRAIHQHGRTDLSR